MFAGSRNVIGMHEGLIELLVEGCERFRCWLGLRVSWIHVEKFVEMHSSVENHGSVENRGSVELHGAVAQQGSDAEWLDNDKRSDVAIGGSNNSEPQIDGRFDNYTDFVDTDQLNEAGVGIQESSVYIGEHDQHQAEVQTFLVRSQAVVQGKRVPSNGSVQASSQPTLVSLLQYFELQSLV